MWFRPDPKAQRLSSQNAATSTEDGNDTDILTVMKVFTVEDFWR